ncbi:Hypothetical predicted protein [Podarcis lilfordi]|uniref:Uncharacterized protein n=1 Tax=Podarcis lilfordi TaxID=74358 RepID=A0AA35P3Q7_9SAUR|nr:Hypothetical predicted protein [Podarcis lilfordi]
MCFKCMRRMLPKFRCHLLSGGPVTGFASDFISIRPSICAGDLHPFHCGEYWIKREQGGDPSDLPPSCIPGLPGSLAQGAPNPEVLQGGDNQSHSEHPWPLGVLQGSPPEPGPGLRGPSAVEFYETPLQSLYGECNPP